MVEFAIILPLLLLLLFGITELGRALYQQNILTQAVELGARYMARVDGAVNVDAGGYCSEGANWGSALGVAKNLVMCGSETGACTEPAVPNLETVNINIGLCGPGVGNDAHESCGEPTPLDCVIAVKATAQFKSIFGDDLISFLGYQVDAVALNAVAQERYIGH
jgi:hypothetical protein